MKTLSYLLNKYIDETKDDSAENTQRGINLINENHKTICAKDNFWWLEKFTQFSTQAGVGAYYLPKTFRKLITVSQTYGTREWPITEMADPVQFNQLFNSSAVQSAFISQYYHIFNNSFRIFPYAANSDNYFKMWYLARPIDMSQLDYTEGSILTLTNNTTTVTGTGTLWLTKKIVVGSSIIINEIPYEIANITSDTVLTIAQPYQGTTISTATPYVIGDLPLIPDDFAILPAIGAKRDYFARRSDTLNYNLADAAYKEMYDALSKSTADKTTENYIKWKRRTVYNPNLYPTLTTSLP